MASSRNMSFFFWQNQWRQYILTKAEVAFSGFLRSSPAQFFSPCQEYIYPSILMKENGKKMISTAVITVAFTFLFTIQIQENCQTKKKTKKRQVT